MANNASNPSTSKAFLLVAVVLGVLATVLAFVFINGSSNTGNGPTTMVTVAKHDMLPMTVIDPDRDLMQLPMPAGFRPLAQKCLDFSAKDLYKGARVNRQIFASQPILLADIAHVGTLYFEKPYMAMEIPAETAQIIPGDYVKVVVTKPTSASVAAADPNAPPNTAIVLGKDGYKVLAVGGYTDLTRAEVTAAGPSMSFKKITLMVTEDQAKEIKAAIGSSSSNQTVTLLLVSSTLTTPPVAEK